MNHIQEQILYTIVGTVKLSKDKFLELMEELIQNQQYTEDEGKRVTREILQKIETIRNDMQLAVTLRMDETKRKIRIPVQKKINLISKELKQKVQEYSFRQLFSN